MTKKALGRRAMYVYILVCATVQGHIKGKNAHVHIFGALLNLQHIADPDSLCLPLWTVPLAPQEDSFTILPPNFAEVSLSPHLFAHFTLPKAYIFVSYLQ